MPNPFVPIVDEVPEKAPADTPNVELELADPNAEVEPPPNNPAALVEAGAVFDPNDVEPKGFLFGVAVVAEPPRPLKKPPPELLPCVGVPAAPPKKFVLFVPELVPNGVLVLLEPPPPNILLDVFEPPPKTDFSDEPPNADACAVLLSLPNGVLEVPPPPPNIDVPVVVDVGAAPPPNIPPLI